VITFKLNTKPPIFHSDHETT